jgi:hypothetical protein
MRALKPVALLGVLSLFAALPAAAQQGVTTDRAPLPASAPTTPAPVPAPRSSPLYESNTPAPATIKEAQEENAAAMAASKHTITITTLALVVALVVLIFVL